MWVLISSGVTLGLGPKCHLELSTFICISKYMGAVLL